MIDNIRRENIECLYCNKDINLKKWFSEWNEDHHYKTFNCGNCGKKNFVRVKFHGSGHDSWSQLETKIDDS